MEIKEPRYYQLMWHCCVTDQLSKLSTKTQKKKNPVEENFRTYRLKQGVTFYLPLQDDGKDLSMGVAAYKLIDALTIQLTKKIRHGTIADSSITVCMQLADYARMCYGENTRKSRDTAARAVTLSLPAMTGIRASWESKRGEKIVTYDKAPLFTQAKYEDGKITACFSLELVTSLLHGPVVPYPDSMFRIDGRNLNAWSLGRKLVIHGTMRNNVLAKTSRRISVKAFLESAPDIPSYEEVMNTNRHYFDRIIYPLKMTMDELTEKNIVSRYSFYIDGTQFTHVSPWYEIDASYILESTMYFDLDSSIKPQFKDKRKITTYF